MCDDQANDFIVRIRDDHAEINSYLTGNEVVSLKLTLDDVFKKNLLLSASSYFEIQIRAILLELYTKNCHGEYILTELVKAKILKRGYSGLFQWEDYDASGFFKLFGTGFNEYMQYKIANDCRLEDSIKAFIKIGGLRNGMIHQNLVMYSLDKTLDEVFDLYEKAVHFIETLPGYFEDYIARNNP